MRRDRSWDPSDLAAARRGDAHAWTRIHAHWSPTVYRWCARYGGPDTDAEDATQDVFVLLHRHVERLTGPEVLASWLHATAYNVCRSQRRLALTRVMAWLEPFWPAPRSTHPDGRLEQTELQRDVFSILSALSAEHQTALVLCKLEGRTFAEAAELLGVPAGTVASRLQRALERFAELARKRGLEAHLMGFAPDDLLSA